MVDRIEALVLQMSADIRKMERALNQARGQTNRQLSAVEKRFDQMNAHVRRSGDEMARDLRTAIATIGVGLAIREVTQYADAWTTARNKLAAAGVASEDLARTQDQLTDLALETRTSLEATVDLYARLTRSTDALGVSQAQVYRATEIANKAFKAGGAAASEQASAVLQLGQALGSGVLAGDELRSLRENAPLLAKAIADEFEVTVAGLKKLGETGKLTSDRVFQAILNAGKEIEEQFNSTVSTIGDAFTNLQSAFTRFIGQNDEASGASRKLAGFINDVATNFDRLADAAVIAAQVLGGTLAAAAIINLVFQLNTLVRSLGAAASAMARLRIASAFLLGPMGAVVTAIGAAVAAFAIDLGRADTEADKLDRNLKALAETVNTNRATLAEAGIDGFTTQLTEAEVAAARLEKRMRDLRSEAEKSGAWSQALAASRQWEANFAVRNDIAALEREIANPTERVFVERQGFIDVPRYSPTEIAKLREQLAESQAALAEGERIYVALLNAPRAAFAEREATASGGTTDDPQSKLKRYTTAIEEYNAALAEILSSQESMADRSRAAVQAVLDLAQGGEIGAAFAQIPSLTDLLTEDDETLLAGKLTEMAEAAANAVAVGFDRAVLDHQKRMAEIAQARAAAIAAGISDLAQFERAAAEADAELTRAYDDFVGMENPYDIEALSEEMRGFVDDIEWEVAGEELRQVMRDSVKNAMREGIRTGDWGDAFAMVLADAVTAGLDDALNRIGDFLADQLFGDNGLFSNIANAASNWLFSPRASGGAVMAGQGYRINDRGDGGEFLFMGSNPGQVLRQHEVAGLLGNSRGGATVINANLMVEGSIDAVTWPKVQEAMRQQTRQIMSAVPTAVNATLIDNRTQKRRF